MTESEIERKCCLKVCDRKITGKKELANSGLESQSKINNIVLATMDPPPPFFRLTHIRYIPIK